MGNQSDADLILRPWHFMEHRLRSWAWNYSSRLGQQLLDVGSRPRGRHGVEGLTSRKPPAWEEGRWGQPQHKKREGRGVLGLGDCLEGVLAPLWDDQSPQKRRSGQMALECASQKCGALGVGCATQGPEAKARLCGLGWG